VHPPQNTTQISVHYFAPSQCHGFLSEQIRVQLLRALALDGGHSPNLWVPGIHSV